MTIPKNPPKIKFVFDYDRGLFFKNSGVLGNYNYDNSTISIFLPAHVDRDFRNMKKSIVKTITHEFFHHVMRRWWYGNHHYITKKLELNGK